MFASLAARVRLNSVLCLWCLCLVPIVTATKIVAEGPIASRLIVQKSISLEAPNNLGSSTSAAAHPGANDNVERHSRDKVNGFRRRTAQQLRDDEYRALPSVDPADRKGTRASRTYLPPGRVPASLREDTRVDDIDTPLDKPKGYSTESWDSSREARARLDLLDWETPENSASASLRGPLRDTKPVHEFINEEYSPLPGLSHSQRDFEISMHGPRGNRGKEQSTGPNTVTSLAARPPCPPPSSSLLRPTKSGGSLIPEGAIPTGPGSFYLSNWFLTDEGYNSPLHPPPNPIISLVLSHYGRYLSDGSHPSKVYSYMAANNIHNNKPFGQYKLSNTV